MQKLYKSKNAKDLIMTLYDEKLNSLEIVYDEIDVKTSFGRTRVIKTGNENGQKIVLFHGINAGAPLTLEAVKGLRNKYLLYAIDTIGQATKSDENRINIKDNSYALWAIEVLKELQIKEANFIGISYGSYILKKLISHSPEKVLKCLFIVPSGLVNGAFRPSLMRLTLLLIRFHITKKDNHLKAFLKAFVPEDDEFMFKLQKAMLLGVNMDYRRPVLLQEKEIQNFTNPVYIMVADDDIFFPGNAAINRAKKIFRNIQDIYVLKNCKHMPARDLFPVIEDKIKLWIG